MPQRHFVTRHAGAIAWAKRHGLHAQWVPTEHFDASGVGVGDVVIGTLPIQLVVEVNERGGSYWHLAMDVPPAWRGRELSADEMDACGARLHEFRVTALGPRTEGMDQAAVSDDRTDERPALHLCIATGQQLPNAVSIGLSRWDRVVVFASPRMKSEAERLADFVADEVERRGRPPEAAEVLHYALPPVTTLRAVREALQMALADLRQRFPGHQLVLNITGGLKLMTLAFADVFRGQARILYCDAERGVLEAVEPEGSPAVPIGPHLDLSTFMRVQGFRIVAGGSVADERRQVIEERRALTATLALRLPGLGAGFTARVGELSPSPATCHSFAAMLYRLAATALDSGRDGGGFDPLASARLIGGSRIPPEGMALIGQLQLAGLLARGTQVRAAGPELHLVFADIDAARYLSGGFLEEFAWLSALAAGLPQTHVGLGTEIDALRRRAGRRGQELNELDVAVTWNARLLIIECKAGRQLADGDQAQRVIHRAAALRHAIGGVLASSWLVGNNDLPESRRADIEERARTNRIERHLGPGSLAALPRHIAAWARLEGNAPGCDWRAQVIDLAAGPAHGTRPTGKRRK